MRFLSSVALAALAFSVTATPALAQKKDDKAAPAGQEAPRQLKLSKEAGKALAELEKSVRAQAADVPAKMAAAQPLLTNTDDKYFFARMMVLHSANTGDKAAQVVAAQAVIDSGGADPKEAGEMATFIAGQKFANKDFAGAELAYAPLLAASPTNVDLVVQMARIKLELNKNVEAADLLKKAIDLNTAAGNKPPEIWYRSAITNYHKAGNAAAASEMARASLAAYPTKDNFTNVIATAQAAIKSADVTLDLLRLRYDAGLINDANAFTFLASNLNIARNWGEAKSVVETAKRLGKSDADQEAILGSVSGKIAEDKAALPTLEARAKSDANGVLALKLAEAYSGYGEYTKAAEFFRVALQKGGVDAALVNTRLGIALSRGGDAAGAKAAFEAVGNAGQRGTLAQLWLAWLALPKA